jgi:hypothetical protein
VIGQRRSSKTDAIGNEKSLRTTNSCRRTRLADAECLFDDRKINRVSAEDAKIALIEPNCAGPDTIALDDATIGVGTRNATNFLCAQG